MGRPISGNQDVKPVSISGSQSNQNWLSDVGVPVSKLSKKELTSFGKSSIFGGKSKLQSTLNKLNKNKGTAQIDTTPQKQGLEDSDVANIKAYMETLDPRSKDYKDAKETITKTLVKKNLNIKMKHFMPADSEEDRIKKFKIKQQQKIEFESALTQFGNLAKSSNEDDNAEKLKELKNTIEGYVKSFDESTPEHSAARMEVTKKLLDLDKAGVSSV